MGEITKIAWTQHTFNPVWGCTKVSPGCDNCYAAELDKRWFPTFQRGPNPEPAHWGKSIPRRTFKDSHWNEPLTWNRDAAKNDVQEKVFCGSMCDVMDDEWPDGVRERLWDLINQTPNLIWQLLTKRPHRYHRYLPRDFFKHKNVWVGTSCENQEFYNVRWPILQTVRQDWGFPAFISYEPALGPLSIKEPEYKGADVFGLGKPDWVICGGESGTGRRPMELVWAENIKQECASSGVAFYMKQMGARTPEEGARLIPAHLLVRQFPDDEL